MSQAARTHDPAHPILLHVEDRDEDARLFRIVLEEVGIQASVPRAYDGEQAMLFLHQLGRFRDAPTPSVVFLDLNMPRMNGWEVLGAMAHSGRLRQIPVVMLTTSWRDQPRALALGACNYIAKPSNLTEFVSEVQRVFRSVFCAGTETHRQFART